MAVCIFVLRVKFLCCWRVSLVCLALKLVGSWVELRFSCRYGSFWMSSCQLMFPGVRSFLVFSLFGLSLLPLAFSLILTVASRLLHPYSTNDKTSRVMVKIFSTVRDTQKGSQSYMEKRRGKREIGEEGDRGDQKEKRGNQKGRAKSSQ